MRPKFHPGRNQVEAPAPGGSDLEEAAHSKFPLTHEKIRFPEKCQIAAGCDLSMNPFIPFAVATSVRINLCVDNTWFLTGGCPSCRDDEAGWTRVFSSCLPCSWGAARSVANGFSPVNVALVKKCCRNRRLTRTSRADCASSPPPPPPATLANTSNFLCLSLGRRGHICWE